MNDDLKIRQVELILDGRVEECPYTGPDGKEKEHTCPSGIIFESFVSIPQRSYFMPCRDHINYYKRFGVYWRVRRCLKYRVAAGVL